MLYGSLEYAYAQPIAEALAADATFRSWMIGRTMFAAYSKHARLLLDEMRAARSKGSANWWRSHFTEKCRCNGCRGQETDILAIFEAASGPRFALHFEVKQPTDNFSAKRNQAANYAIRASCWVRTPPKAIVPHNAAGTVLLCSAFRLSDYAQNVAKFDSVMTFEEIASAFPRLAFPAE